MTRFQSILVAADFSPAAAHAVRRAAVIAEQQGCRLKLLHAVDPVGSQALRRLLSGSIDVDLKVGQATASLREFAGQIIVKHRIEVTFDVVVGDACREILAASQRADLVVLGQGGAGWLKDHRIGSNADRVVRTCRTPVLVVKLTEDRPYRRVLVPVDFTLYSDAALGTASSLSPRGAVHVFHACREIEHAQTRARLHALAAKVGLEPGRVDVRVAQGNAWRTTLEQEKAVQADLIVAGKQGRSTIADFLLGSVTRRLLAHSRCDVLVMPRAAAEAWRPLAVELPSRLPPVARDGAL